MNITKQGEAARDKRRTEHFLGGVGLERVDADEMARLPCLEVLWLNNNCLSKLNGLQHNWRLRELYLQNNQITTVCNVSCCLSALRHLDVLQLENNLLQDLAGTLQVLSRLSIKQLNLNGNPLSAESNYRNAVLTKLPGLDVFDCLAITEDERANAAVVPVTRKTFGFGTVVESWEKPVKIVVNAPSHTEVSLLKVVNRTLRQRGVDEKEADAAAFREAARPEFDLVNRQPDGRINSTPYQFMAHGRVPAVRLRCGSLRLRPAAVSAAAAVATVAGPAAAAEVYVALNAMRILPDALRTRCVKIAHANEKNALDMRFDENLLEANSAAAYVRILQLLDASDDAAMCLVASLCEASSGRSIATARVPFAKLFKERSDQSMTVTASFGGIGRLELTLSSDWNMTHTPSDHLRHRRDRLQEEARMSRKPAAKPSARVPKDFIKRHIFERTPLTDEPTVQPVADELASLQFDAPRYQAFLASRAPVRLRPLSCTV